MTTNRRSFRTAKEANLEHVLVFYDGPQIALLRTDTGGLLIGHAVEHVGYKFPLVCCEPLDRYLNSYLKGKVDLKFVFDVTPKNRMYFADLGHKDTPIELVRIKDVDDELLPEPGVFSTVHTHPVGDTPQTAMHRLRFLVDGIWEARDFSQFYGKLADAYSLQSIARNLNKGVVSIADEVFLKATINDREWQGGGSYLSFYGGVKQHLETVHPLRVTGIEYHSPGYVEVAGDRDGLEEVVLAIRNVIENHASLVKSYSAIRKSLRNEGLLSADKSSEFSANIVREYVLNQSDLLAQQLGLPNQKLILEACENNVAVYAKLVMSYFRRIKGIARFYVEGRAQTED